MGNRAQANGDSQIADTFDGFKRPHICVPPPTNNDPQIADTFDFFNSVTLGTSPQTNYDSHVADTVDRFNIPHTWELPAGQ